MAKIILIVKHGARGDVVRTSYFCRSIFEKYKGDVLIYWLTSSDCVELLNRNPYIFKVLDNSDHLSNIWFDIIYSLDDEISVLEAHVKIRCGQLVGAYLSQGLRLYTEDTACWFDMGLISKHGKSEADILKKSNKLGHAEIFKKIFGVDEVIAEFFPSRDEMIIGYRPLDQGYFNIGINPYSGGRWPAKELRETEFKKLIDSLVEMDVEKKFALYLFGAGGDRQKNLNISKQYCGINIVVIDSDESMQLLARYVKDMNVMITSDSLAMHLAISQGVRTISFFAPTSAAEIDGFGCLEKVTSTAVDYCSYRPDADNSSITAIRILNTAVNLIRDLLPKSNR